MLSLHETQSMNKPSVLAVHYARLYSALEGYAIVVPTGLTYFVDHDGGVDLLSAEQSRAVVLLGAVSGVERANVLQALAQCGEV